MLGNLVRHHPELSERQSKELLLEGMEGWHAVPGRATTNGLLAAYSGLVG